VKDLKKKQSAKRMAQSVKDLKKEAERRICNSATIVPLQSFLKIGDLTTKLVKFVE
jgi:hypothetical protein